MRYDVHPPLGHPEIAGWVLGALDRAEAEAFGRHVLSCVQCQAAAAEFEAVAKALDQPVPADDPPAGLEARVMAAVQYAALTPGRPAEAAQLREEEPLEAAGIPQAEQTWQAMEAWQTEGGPGDASQPGPVVLIGTAHSG
jgi:anti-sigma factor ChrR (cupin superfamily)